MKYLFAKVSLQGVLLELYNSELPLDRQYQGAVDLTGIIELNQIDNLTIKNLKKIKSVLSYELNKPIDMSQWLAKQI